MGVVQQLLVKLSCALTDAPTGYIFEHRWEHSVLSRCDLVSYLHTIACHNCTKKQHVWQRKLANRLPSTKSCCRTDLLHWIDGVGTFCAESGRAAKRVDFF